MTKVKWVVLVLLVAALGCVVGCDGDDDDALDPAGRFAGTWTGRVCGRGLTMTLTQKGNTLSGTYSFTDPLFEGTVQGSVSSGKPPATARLNCGGHDWWFDLAFGSYTQMTGGFYKPEAGGLVCNVSATK